MPILYNKGNIRSSHSVHPPSLWFSAPSCASICWKNVLNWTSQITVFLKTKAILKKDNYHSKIFYLDPIAQVVWIMGNRQLHSWDRVQAAWGKLCFTTENQHGTMKPEKNTLWLLSWSQRPCFWRAHKSVLSLTLRCYNKLLDNALMVQIKMPALYWWTWETFGSQTRIFSKFPNL